MNSILMGFFSLFIANMRVYAEDWVVRGHIKPQYSALSSPLGGTSSNSSLTSLDSRLHTLKRWERFEFEADGQLLGFRSTTEPSPSSFRFGTAGGLLPSDNRRLFQLTKSFLGEGEGQAALRADRLSLSLLLSNTTVRIGRQALSMGNGLGFQVLDIVNSFSPFSIDREYKTGDDLVYLQHLLSNGDNTQLAVVPRRDTDSGDVESNDSTYMGAYQGRLASVGMDYLAVAALHYGNPLFGLGSSTSLFQGVLREDVRFQHTDNIEGIISFVVNYDRSWEVLGKNLYTFIEFYRNGAGNNSASLAALQANRELQDELMRGEVFVIGKYYSLYGIRLEVTPLLNFLASQTFELQKGSTLIQLRAEYEATQSLLLTIGADLPVGSSGSEFGERQITPMERVKPSRDLYLRASYYF